MICRIAEMRNKEVINIRDGCIIGCVNDVEIDMHCAKLIAIIIYGKLKLFGILGREDDIVIKWDNIEVVGEDAILVKFSPPFKKKKKPNFFKKFFNN